MAEAIHGRGAFRFFRATADRFDLKEQWYAFESDEYARLARDWCQANDIAFTE